MLHLLALLLVVVVAVMCDGDGADGCDSDGGGGGGEATVVTAAPFGRQCGFWVGTKRLRFGGRTA